MNLKLMSMNNHRTPVVLCILDGWGVRPDAPDNAITQAHTPVWSTLTQKWPLTTLKASGKAVGLPEGQMGNSEVGHMTMGAGRVILQDLPKINDALEDASLFNHSALVKMVSTLKARDKACHIMALLSDGGVHAHINHIDAILEFLGKQQVSVWIHGFLDGRDTPPQSASFYLQKIEALIKKYPDFLRWGTLGGRYFAMDRDHRWDRIQKAYFEMVSPCSFQETPLEALQLFYDKGITDEFISPFSLLGYTGIAENDALLMLNFRSDRIRQILSVLLDQDFQEFPRQKIRFSCALSLTEVFAHHHPKITALFPQEIPAQVLGELISNQGLRQLHIGETEKYAHITFFFNGGREDPFPLEDRALISSSQVATYDLYPEMSAKELTIRLTHEISEKKYDFIVVNYANPDMVGHTGNQEATRKAIETIDTCLGHLSQCVLKEEGCLLITADHGNAEMMIDPQTGERHTAHTCNPVPFLIVGQTHPLRSGGGLEDIAPTICDLMGLPPSPLMTGRSLLEEIC